MDRKTRQVLLRQYFVVSRLRRDEVCAFHMISPATLARAMRTPSHQTEGPSDEEQGGVAWIILDATIEGVALGVLKRFYANRIWAEDETPLFDYIQDGVLWETGDGQFPGRWGDGGGWWSKRHLENMSKEGVSEEELISALTHGARGDALRRAQALFKTASHHIAESWGHELQTKSWGRELEDLGQRWHPYKWPEARGGRARREEYGKDPVCPEGEVDPLWPTASYWNILINLYLAVQHTTRRQLSSLLGISSATLGRYANDDNAKPSGLTSLVLALLVETQAYRVVRATERAEKGADWFASNLKEDLERMAQGADPVMDKRKAEAVVERVASMKARTGKRYGSTRVSEALMAGASGRTHWRIKRLMEFLSVLSAAITPKYTKENTLDIDENWNLHLMKKAHSGLLRAELKTWLSAPLRPRVTVTDAWHAEEESDFEPAIGKAGRPNEEFQNEK
jgi:hypothetical protein